MSLNVAMLPPAVFLWIVVVEKAVGFTAMLPAHQRVQLDGVDAVEYVYGDLGVVAVQPGDQRLDGPALGIVGVSGQAAGALQTLKYSLVEVKYWIVETGRGLGRLFTGKLKSNEIGSAVAMVDFIGTTYEVNKEYGVKDTVLSLLYITVFLSANIGVMNLLPIPALDGGKLLFCAIEVIRRKPVDREKEGMVHFIGLVLLMILMVFLIFNDVKNIFFTK